LQTLFGLVLPGKFKQAAHGQAVRLLGEATAICSFGCEFLSIGHEPLKRRNGLSFLETTLSSRMLKRMGQPAPSDNATSAGDGYGERRV
jgi:hypothetical protein